MPMYQIDVEKSFQNEYWTNVYHCEVTGFAEAEIVASNIIEAERDCHLQAVQFTKHRIAPFPLNGAQGTIIADGLVGTVVGTDHLPLFNVCTVLFSPQQGRPSRKYLRLPVIESQVSNGAFLGPALDNINLLYSQVLLNLDELRDVKGRPFVAVNAVGVVGMRQLRRGSKRRTQPVI